jgi:hypothetical protein
MPSVLTERLIAVVDHLASVEHRHDLGIPWRIANLINRHLVLRQRTATTVLRLRASASVEEQPLRAAHTSAVALHSESI